MRKIRMCNNQKCLWSGPEESTKSLNPGIHFLCPDCGETTEEATDKEAAEYYVGWIGDLQNDLNSARATNDRQSTEIAVLLAEAKELFRQLAEAQAQCGMYEADISRLSDELRTAQDKAAKWDAVPWDVVARIAYPVSGWPEHDDVFDLRTYYDRSKPEGVQP